MKLFQRLLVAPAALGLLAPMSANATEVNLNDIGSYSDIESIEFANSFDNNDLEVNPLLAGGEGLVDDHSHNGGFSETTTASFSADMYLGSVQGGANNLAGRNTTQALNATYSFQIDLNTSFTGDDSLDVSIDAGNSSAVGTVEFDGNGSGDTMFVDGVSYTFPIGDSATAFVGDSVDGSTLFTTACVYGGPSNTLDDCGNVYSAIGSGTGTAFGASYDFGNGFTSAFGVTTAGSTANGVLTAESNDAYGINAAYTADNYGISLSYADIETTINAVNIDVSSLALNAYYTPEADGMPSISGGYETADYDDGTAADDLESNSWFVGLSWDEIGPGTGGIAIGTKQHTIDAPGEQFEEMLMYEAYYTYDINDGMSVTPLVYIKQNAQTGVEDETGMMVKTSFSF